MQDDDNKHLKSFAESITRKAQEHFAAVVVHARTNAKSDGELANVLFSTSVATGATLSAMFFNSKMEKASTLLSQLSDVVEARLAILTEAGEFGEEMDAVLSMRNMIADYARSEWTDMWEGYLRLFAENLGLRENILTGVEPVQYSEVTEALQSLSPSEGHPFFMWYLSYRDVEPASFNINAFAQAFKNFPESAHRRAVRLFEEDDSPYSQVVAYCNLAQGLWREASKLVREEIKNDKFPSLLVVQRIKEALAEHYPTE